MKFLSFFFLQRVLHHARRRVFTEHLKQRFLWQLTFYAAVDLVLSSLFQCVRDRCEEKIKRITSSGRTYIIGAQFTVTHYDHNYSLIRLMNDARIRVNMKQWKTEWNRGNEKSHSISFSIISRTGREREREKKVISLHIVYGNDAFTLVFVGREFTDRRIVGRLRHSLRCRVHVHQRSELMSQNSVEKHLSRPKKSV